MIKKLSMLTVVCLLLLPITVFAAPYYDAGAQRFSVSAGLSVPLTVTDFAANKTGVGPGPNNTHLSLGGYGSISYQVFMNEYVAFGGEIGYMFNYDNEAILSNVPLQAKITVLPVQGVVDIPISLGVGAAFLSKSTSTMLTPYVSAEVGFDFYFNDNWGLGVHTGLWLVPELYLFSGRKSFNGLGTFIPAVLAVTYRQ